VPAELSEAARERLAARTRRTTMIRRGVVAAALSAFVLAWGVIARTGPMGSEQAAASGQTTSSGSAQTSSSDDSSQMRSDDDSGAVTTAQS
jgi:hypothetical protein